GRVFLLNPNGVLFGSGASVDVGSLFTTTFEIDNADFLAGRYAFENRGATGHVENRGRIHVADGGFVVMTAEQVANSGLIQARLGDVHLASGSAVTMDLTGDGLINLQVTEAALSEVAGVTNVGEIVADGGRVAMTARVARQLQATVVNNEGLVRAGGIEESGGAIYLTASGGDVANSGTLDVSGRNGQDAGDVRLVSDRSVALADTSRILARGEHGMAEISGSRVRIRGDVRLGEYGSLFIDPTDLIVGEDESADLLVSDLESLLREGPRSSTVFVVAENSVLFLDVADGLIDGTNSGSGAGLLVGIGFVDGGYFRGSSGSVTFQDVTDEIRTDGALAMFSGSLAGSLTLGNLTAGGDVVVEGAETVSVGDVAASGADVQIGSSGGVIVAGDLAGRRVGVQSGNGIVQVGAVDAGKLGVSITSGNADTSDDVGGPVSGIAVESIASRGGVSLRATDASAGGLGIGVTVNGATQARDFVAVDADSGDVTLGDVRVDSRGTDAGASINVSALAGRITTGDLDILAGSASGASGLFSSSGDVSIDGHANLRGASAGLDIEALGAVQITGAVTVIGEGFAGVLAGGSTSISFFEGNGRFDVSGQDIDLLGDLTVRGVGNTTARMTSDTDITIAGDTRIVATPARIETTLIGEQTVVTTERTGVASLEMVASPGTPSTISTGDVVVSGPDARVLARAGQIRIGSGTAGTDAIRVTALPGGIDSGAYYRQEQDGVTVAESTAGAAAITLIADAPSDGPGVVVNGDLTARGPVAGVTLLGTDGVTVGAVDVTGIGYTASGDHSRPPQAAFIGGNDDIPRLDQGTLTWGSATLDVDGGDGLVSMGGVSLEGVGQASASIVAGDASLGAVSITASDGSVDGSYTQQETIGGQSYLVTHRLDDGDGGAARFAGAHLDLAFSGSSASLDSLAMSGTDVEGAIDGGGAVAIAGDVTLAGAGADSAPTVRDRVSYADDPTDGTTATPIASTSTRFTGGRTLLGVGFVGDTPSSFTSGDITMSGAGVTGLSIAAGSTTVGDIDVSASEGRFVTNDAIHNEGLDPGETVNDRLGHVFVSLGSTNDPAAIGSLAVDAAGDVFLGVQAVASGDVTIGAGGALRAATPDELLLLANPVQVAMDANGGGTGDSADGGDGEESRLLPKVDLPLQDTKITGTNVAVDFGDDSTLNNLELIATGTMAVNGNGASLTAGGGTLKLDAQQTLTVTDVLLKAANATLAGGDVRLGGASVDGGNLLLIARAGSVTDQGQAFVFDVDSLGVSATDAVQLTAGTMNVGTGETTVGGDAALIAQLVALGLPVPDTTNPNASFVGSGVSIGGLNLAGDYLFLQGDQVAAGFTAPNDLTLQFVPNTPTASVGLENAPASNRDVNLNVEQNFPDLTGNTVIIGSTTYGGDINVGENGPVTPPAGTSLVLVTSGNIVRPSQIQTDSPVTTIGTVVETPVVPPVQDEVESVQNDPVPTGAPPPPVLPDPESELIDQTTDTGPDLVCT
ncbi:MAG TPA: hypothetical protein VJM11_20935, partial [Nevskiaceae bacterium]|nr:hypothetical protein [Nevskiaceae bacterium]